MSTIAITADLLERACACSGYPIPEGELVFFGVRGALPDSAASTSFSQSQVLRFEEIDYRNMRCTIGQWNTVERSVATYPGSTVPSLPNIASAKERGGAGANMLLPGRHEYIRGRHKDGKPSGHRAFRQAGFFPVRRTRNNTSYDAFDDIDFGSSSGDFVWDNLHSAYSASLTSYSSAGCQVVCGLPASASRGNQPETGPWRDFIHVAYDVFGNQKRYTYFLFTAEELSAFVTAAPGALRQVVRFGSVGPAARMVQEALIQSGDLAGAADGDFGRKSLMALVKYQSRMFPRSAVDGVCGPNTLNSLNIQLPAPGGAVPAALATPATEPTVPESDIDDETDMPTDEVQRLLALLGIGQAPPSPQLSHLPPDPSQMPPLPTFDFGKFVQAIRSGPFSGLPSQAQSGGMRQVIDAFFRFYPDGDPRWLAYILATVFHETGRFMVPVREGFTATDVGARAAVKKMFDQGRISRDYAIPDPVTGQSYFGRGRVQNTHKSNYAKLSERFGRDFVNQPGLLLDSQVDAEVSVVGHVEGLWTGRKLSNYIGGGQCDYREARRIVNRTDKADQIAGYARQFEGAINAALTPGLVPPNVATNPDSQQGETPVREDIIEAVLEVLRQRQDNTSLPAETRPEQLTEILAKLAGVKPPLTPVNAALGEGVGRLLEGKKSIIGIGGAVLAAIAGKGGPNVDPIVNAVTNAVPLLTGMSGTALPLFVAMAAWGLLGKVEKMVRSSRLR